MNSEIKNLVLAIVLSTLVLSAWHFLVEKPKYEAAIRENAASVAAVDQAPTLPKDVEVMPVSSVAAVPVSRNKALSKSQRIHIESDHLSGSISLTGARFDDLTLHRYKQSIQPDAKDVELLSPSSTENVYFAEFGWVSADRSLSLPGAKSVWQSNDKVLSPQNPILLKWDNGQGITFVRKISMDSNYMFNVTQEAINNSGKDLSLAPYGLINRTKEPYEDFLISHEGVLGVFDSVLFDELTYNDMLDDMQKGQKRKFKNVSGWLGMADKYWLTAIIPSAGEKFHSSFSYNVVNQNNRYQAEVIGVVKNLEEGQRYNSVTNFYAGAKEVDLLDKYQEDMNIPLFDRAVDFGWLYFMTKPIFYALTFFNSLVDSFGIAILILTVCIKGALFPLANKGFISMNKLKALSPEMKSLRERYKDDKVGLQKEMMALYKKEKVNPMSGCLPILIQLPIFFSLYKVLFVSIEMRHADFYGWIHDLSAPDPTSLFNLFGLLPFTPPDMLMIGVWPCIMAITMIIQQKLNPPPPDPVQANIIQALPFVFVFLFAKFPAGLIIYWAWSNTLSIAQQWMISRVLPAKRESKKSPKS